MRTLFTGLWLAASLTAASAADHGAVTVESAFGDWAATCYADGFCAATTSLADAEFHIGRHAEKPYWEIAFTAKATPDTWADFIVDVGADTETFVSQTDVGAYGSRDTVYFLGDKAQALFDQIVPASEVKFTYTDLTQTVQTVEFPLKGLAAALIYIDEQQTRIGSERVASPPPWGLVPLYAEADTDPAVVPVALLDRHRADPECRPLEDIANGRDFYVDVLDADYTVYILPCDSYAYNFTSKVYIGGFDEFTPVYFAEYGVLGWTGTSVVFFADYDSDTNTLYSSYKGRGLGDCGSQGIWEWAEYGFRMVEFRYKGECDGDTDPDPYEFPIIFPTADAGGNQPGGSKEKSN
ncbi:MAG: hypothetical protein JWR75_477 [Devosia sp.]|nr:hypothetical protein [Devosia sp.]